MMQLHTYFDVELLRRMKSEGYVRAVQHPRYPLELLNYTPKTQYDKVWNPVTRAARGLIWNFETGEVVAFPFRKFFNLEEWGTNYLPGGPIRVHEKMDGSLGILYQEPGGLPAIATRGSFSSEQAAWATMWFRNNALDYYWPDDSSTHLFEIIYPANRIVVDYKGYQGLVLLGTVDNSSGCSHSIWHSPWPNIPNAQAYPFRSVEEIVNSEPRENAEGYVVHFLRTDERVKIKFSEYKRLHAILTECSSVTVWEALRSGTSINALLDSVPDEFYRWVQAQIATLNSAYDAMHYAIHADFHEIKKELLQDTIGYGYPDQRAFRKAFAALARDRLHTSALFALLDNGSISDYIWKQIKPEHSKPFSSATSDTA